MINKPFQYTKQLAIIVNLIMKYIVYKFGGSSQCSQGYNVILNNIIKCKKSDTTLFIIVSAIKSTTNLLYKIINKQKNTFTDIEKLHYDLCSELNINTTKIQDILLHLKTDISLLDSDPLIDITQHRIKIISYGEILSSSILHEFLLTNNITNKLLNSRNFITSERSHTSIDPITLDQLGVFRCQDEISYYIDKDIDVYIAQGFIASTNDNRLCLLSRSGSDTTGSLIANTLNAERYEIWTDVDGIFTSDPREIKEAHVINKINYNICKEISSWGSQVIHPHCIKPCQDKDIPIYIKNTFNPEADGTIINGFKITNNNVYCIVNQKNNTVYSVNTKDMWNNTGFASEIFYVFAKHKLDINIITTDNFSITITTNEFSHEKKTRVYNELNERYNVKMIEDCSIVTIVAENILENSTIRNALDYIKDIGKEHLHITHHSTNNISVSYIVDSSVSENLTRLFHRQYIVKHVERVDNMDIWWRKIDLLSKCKILGKKITNPFTGRIDYRGSQYVYSEADIIEKCMNLKNKLTNIDQIFYAMKANNCVHNIIMRHGFGIECVSEREVDYIREFEFGDIHVPIIFTPNYCSIREYEHIFKYENITAIIDNYLLIKDYGEVFKDKEIGVRLDLNTGDGHHDKVITEGDNVKFGMPISDIPKLLKECKKHNVKITILHSHKGSGILNYSAWANTCKKLYDLVDKFPDVNIFNLGGGLGITTNGVKLDLDKMNQEIGKVKRTFTRDIKLIIEPGRYLVAEAGVILTEVTQVRSKNNYRYIGVDAGMNVLIRPMLYGSYHPIYNLTRIDSEKKEIAHIVGPICESGDVLGKNINISKTQVGDILLIENAGAYGSVMSSSYNMRDPPGQSIIT